MDQDVADITRATQDWVAAFEAGDIPGTLAVLTPHAVMVPPNQPELIGVDAIEAWTREMFEAATIQEASTTVEKVRVGGDWAVSHGVWKMTLAVGDAITSDTTRYVLTWERQPDGAWKIVHDVWNSALPLQPES